MQMTFDKKQEIARKVAEIAVEFSPAKYASVVNFGAFVLTHLLLFKIE